MKIFNLVVITILIALIIGSPSTGIGSVNAVEENNSYSLNCTKEVTELNESLVYVLELYNNCSRDYLEGTNCGTISDLLKEANLQLSDNLKTCRSELTDYKVGFWVSLIVPAICIIYFLIIKRKKKQ
jgi:hypothetical protein